MLTTIAITIGVIAAGVVFGALGYLDYWIGQVADTLKALL